MMEITSKAEMYWHLTKGGLGHTLPAVEEWEELALLLSSNLTGQFAIRLKQAGGKTLFNLTPGEVMEKVKSMPAHSWNVSPMLEDSKRLCYGHLYDRGNFQDMELLYSEAGAPCRLKYEQDKCPQKTLKGLSAKLYCQSIMDQRGYDTLNDLLEKYPFHIYEFTVMQTKQQAYGPSNTIFWEVRCDSGAYERRSGWGR